MATVFNPSPQMPKNISMIYESSQFGPNFSCSICGETWTGLAYDAEFWGHVKGCRDAKEHPQPEYFDESNCAWGE